MRGWTCRKHTVLRALDETILTETPPFRIAWGKMGEHISVPITGKRGKRSLYGALSLRSGQVDLMRSLQWRQADFHAFFRQIRRRWRGWRIVLFLDQGSPHTA